jgi:hypothetical protein
MKERLFIQKNTSGNSDGESEIFKNISQAILSIIKTMDLSSDDYRTAIFNYMINEYFKVIVNLKIMTSNQSDDILFLIADYMENGYNQNILDYDFYPDNYSDEDFSFNI